MKLHNLRKQANEKGFTLIELMIVIAIIGILAAVAIPNFIEYKNKSYCTATVNDVGAIGGALADYFAVSTNTTATTSYLLETGSRPQLFIGYQTTAAPAGNKDANYWANTLLLSASTIWANTVTPPVDPATGAVVFPKVEQGAGAVKSGSSYVLYATEGAGNCPVKVTSADTHWINPDTLFDGANNATTGGPRTPIDGPVIFFKTL